MAVKFRDSHIPVLPRGSAVLHHQGWVLMFIDFPGATMSGCPAPANGT